MIIRIITVCAMTYLNSASSSGRYISSGSTILLIFGLYAPILNAVKQVLKLNFEYLPAIMIFTTGILVGVLMVPTSLEISKPPMSISTFNVVFFLIGCTLVPALEKLKLILKTKDSEVAHT